MVGNDGIVLAIALILLLLLYSVVGDFDDNPFVFRESQQIAKTEAGEIRSITVRRHYQHLQNVNVELNFMTLEPQSLLLPLFFNTDFVFYVHTGKARVGWVRKNDLVERNVKRGDIYRIPAGSLFHIFNTDKEERLRLFGILDTSNTVTHGKSQMFFVGGGHDPPSVLSGFDERVLRTAFKVSREDMRELLSSQNSGPIVHVRDKKVHAEGWKNILLRCWNKKSNAPFNLLKKKPDFRNANGWSVIVGEKEYRPLKDSDMGVFMVNLTQGSMISPHWNPRGTEIGIVTRGEGIVQIVYPNGSSGAVKVEMMRVREGEVFVVPRFYAMTHMSFGNESAFEFVGFSTCARGNHPRFLAGVNSVLNVLDKESLALAFGVSSEYVADLLAAQRDAVILACPFCAEGVEAKIERERQREREAAEKEREEEEEAKRRREEEEEAAKKKREEEEEAKKREKEEEKEREEEERKKEEEEAVKKKREEEEEKEREEEERKKEEEAKKEREEEEEAQRREEDAEKEREEEEEAQRREEKAKKEREEEEEAHRREEEAEKEREEEEERERERKARRREEEERREEEKQREEEGESGEEERGSESESEVGEEEPL
eukprot:Gb_30035 [translate_table: standard]